MSGWLNRNSLISFPFKDGSDMSYNGGSVPDYAFLDFMLMDSNGVHGTVSLVSVGGGMYTMQYSHNGSASTAQVANPLSGAEPGSLEFEPGVFATYVVSSWADMPDDDTPLHNPPEMLDSRIASFDTRGVSSLSTESGNSVSGEIFLENGYNTTLSIEGGSVRLDVGRGIGAGTADSTCEYIPEEDIPGYIDYAKLSAKARRVLVENGASARDVCSMHFIFHDGTMTSFNAVVDVAGEQKTLDDTVSQMDMNLVWGLGMYPSEPGKLTLGEIFFDVTVGYNTSASDTVISNVTYMSLCDSADGALRKINGIGPGPDGDFTIYGGNGVSVVPDKSRHSIDIVLNREDM